MEQENGCLGIKTRRSDSYYIQQIKGYCKDMIRNVDILC